MSPVLLQNIVWEIVLSFCWGDQVTCDVTRKKKQHDQNWPFQHLYKDTGPKRRFILHDCTLFAAHQTVESHKRRVSSFCSKVPTQSTREAVDTTQTDTGSKCKQKAFKVALDLHEGSTKRTKKTHKTALLVAGKLHLI